MDRKHAVDRCRHKREGLLDSQHDEEDSADNEKCDDLSAIPGVERAAEIDCHDDADECGDTEDSSNIVKSTEPVRERFARHGIERRQQEEVYRSEDSAYYEVDIERPSPGHLFKSAADDWA